MDLKPKIATKHSIKIEVEKDKKYYWCSCGHSKVQPFCDGSHQGTSFQPMEYIASETMTVGFCGCKHSKKSPICDGAHKNLLEDL